MLKTFFISVLSFVLVFVCQTNSWAELENSTKFADVIALENPNTIEKNKDELIFERANLNALSNFRVFSLWSPNLILPGVAQIMMGEVNIGIFYMVLSPHMLLLLGFIGESIQKSNFSENTSGGMLNGATFSLVFLFMFLLSMHSLANAIDLAIIKVSEEDAKKLTYFKENTRISSNKVEFKVFSF